MSETSGDGKPLPDPRRKPRPEVLEWLDRRLKERDRAKAAAKEDPPGDTPKLPIQ